LFVVAEQTQIQKIGSAWQKFKGGKISFVERSAIGPNPANAIFFQEPNKLRSMPAGMTKLNRKTEISWQLWEKLSERRLAVLWGQGRRELDENNLELWS